MCLWAGLFKAITIKPDVAISNRCITVAVGNTLCTWACRQAVYSLPGTLNKPLGLLSTNMSLFYVTILRNDFQIMRHGWAVDKNWHMPFPIAGYSQSA
jgi:hypothetical protein